MDFDGRHRRPLAGGTPGDQPAWSPDGTRIAFSSNRDGNRDIYVVKVNGSDLRRLTHHEATDEYPAWSPDGERIAFGSLRSGDFEVFVMESDGMGLQQVTAHPAVDFRPAWSPDGDWIAFSSSRADEATLATFNYDLYLMRLDGTGVRQLTHHDDLALRPSWSPAGDRLTYQVGSGEDDDSDWEIYAVEVESGRTQRLAHNQVPDAHPDWDTVRADCRQ
jgi:Tol biopolymer transport system component